MLVAVRRFATNSELSDIFVSGEGTGQKTWLVNRQLFNRKLYGITVVYIFVGMRAMTFIRCKNVIRS